MIELLKISIFKTSKDQSGIEHPLNSFRSTEALESFRKHITEVLIGEVRRLGDNEQITVDLVTREKPELREKNNFKQRGVHEYQGKGRNDIRAQFERFNERGVTSDTNGERCKSGSRLQSGLYQQKKENELYGIDRNNNGWFNRFPISEPTICRRDDGVPCKLDGITFSKHRNESIKAYGNAIVPAVVLQIFKAINEFENQTTLF